MNILKLVHDQQWFADGCVAAVSTGHRRSDNQLPDVEAFAAPRKCDRVPVRVQSAWNGQGCTPNIAACTGQHSFRTRAGVQTIRPITLGSRGSGQPANTAKSNTRVHQSRAHVPARAHVRFLPAETPRLRTLGSIIAGQRRNISGNDMTTVRSHYRRRAWPGSPIGPGKKRNARPAGPPRDGRSSGAGPGPGAMALGRARSGPR